MEFSFGDASITLDPVENKGMPKKEAIVLISEVGKTTRRRASSIWLHDKINNLMIAVERFLQDQGKEGVITRYDQDDGIIVSYYEPEEG